MSETPIKQTTRSTRIGLSGLGSHLGLVAASAVLLALCFPWPGWWWLAYVALVPLGVLTARSDRPWRVMWTTGLVFGLLFWMPRVSWLIPVTFGGWLGTCLVMSLYSGATAWAVNRIARQHRVPMVLTLPLVWASLEMVRGYFPFGGFGWLSLAHTQASYHPDQAAGRLAQVADLFGQHTIALVLAMTNGLIVDLITRPLFKPTNAGKRRIRRSARGGLILWAVIFFGTLIYGQYRLGQTPELLGPGPRVAVVQTNVPQNNQTPRSPQQAVDDWRELIRLTAEVGQNSPLPDLIAWPESVAPAGLNPQALDHYREYGTGGVSDGLAIHDQLQQITRGLSVPLLVGAPAYEDWTVVTDTRDDGSEARYRLPGLRYNAVYLYAADGQPRDLRYDKTHLVPFGEYIPVAESWPWLQDKFMRVFSPFEGLDYTVQRGERIVRYELPFERADSVDGQGGEGDAFRFAAPICYEDTVARVCREMVYGEGGDGVTSPGPKRVDVLVNVTNSAWYDGYSQRPQHLQIATLRCIENRVPMARSVNTGISGVIDSTGRIRRVVADGEGASQYVAGAISDELPIDPRRTLFGVLGGWPIFLLLLITIGLVVTAPLRNRRGSRR